MRRPFSAVLNELPVKATLMKLHLPVLLLASAVAFAEEPPKPKRAVLGLESHAAAQEEEEPLGLEEVLVDRVCGVVVDKVAEGGAAAKAGIKAGDVLLQFGDQKLFTNDDLTDQLKVAKPGAEVKVRLKRSDTLKEETVTVTLTAEDGAAWPGVEWTYAGPEQLDDALAEAKKAGKKVLVGASGAET